MCDQIYQHHSLEPLGRYRLHKAKVIRIKAAAGRLFSIGQDQRLVDYDIESSIESGCIQSREGFVDFALDSANRRILLAKQRSLACYSIENCRTPSFEIDLTSREDASLRCASWTSDTMIACGFESGSLLLYDIRNTNSTVSEILLESKLNRIEKLSSGEVVTLSNRVDIFTGDMRWLENVDIEADSSSLVTLAEDASRSSIFVGGFDQKIHILRIKPKQ